MSSSLPLEVCRTTFFDKYRHDEKLGERVKALEENMKIAHSMPHKQKRDKIYIPMADFSLHEEDALRQEGFWCENEDKDTLFKAYPYPEENQLSATDCADFLVMLDKVEAKTRKQYFMGYSTCRCCGVLNGTGTYISSVYAWPEGYRHYIAEHKVMPSAGFVLFIRGLAR